MKTKGRRTNGPRSREAVASTFLAGDPDIYSGEEGARGLAKGGLLFGKPGDLRKAQKKARMFAGSHWMVEATLAAKLMFYDFELELKMGKGGRTDTDGQGRTRTGGRSDAPRSGGGERVADPRSGDARSDAEFLEAHQGELRAYVLDVWRHWLGLDSVVSFWREGGPLITLKPEQCEFVDAMGVPVLIYEPDLTEKQKEAIEPSELRERYSKKEVVIGEGKWNRAHPDLAEHYRVLRRGIRGMGFAWPKMWSVFNTLAQSADMEVGEKLLAIASKTLLRVHHKGHEIKAGVHAGKSTHFMKKEFPAQLQTDLKGKSGLIDMPANFDHKISYVWIDPKLYTGEKWESVVRRLLWWGGPAAWMVMAKGVSPFLMTMLKTEAAFERRLVKEHCEEVFFARYGRRIQLKWSNRCFQETRLAHDMLKFLLTSGPMGSGVALEEAGYDVERVREDKKGDLAMAKEMLMPVFDAAHGAEAAGKGKKGRGRPEGTPDPE